MILTLIERVPQPITEETLKKFLNSYWPQNKKYMRLGQAFVNYFIKAPWPELFYEQDKAMAKVMIMDYMERHCYSEIVPNSWYKDM